MESGTLPHTISPLNGFQEPKNKAADCLSWLLKPTSTSTSVNMLTASHTGMDPLLTLDVIHKTPIP